MDRIGGGEGGEKISYNGRSCSLDFFTNPHNNLAPSTVSEHWGYIRIVRGSASTRHDLDQLEQPLTAALCHANDRMIDRLVLI
jgi:hypothetical protein